jgi:hypothetical protein
MGGKAPKLLSKISVMVFSAFMHEHVRFHKNFGQ